MVQGLESVTVGVDDLDGALALFGDIEGLRRESDANASVNLLAAWRYPVHADVRLVELACKGRPGRVRLARFDPHVGPGRKDFEGGSARSGERDDAASVSFYSEGLGLVSAWDEAMADGFLKVIRRLARAEEKCDLLSLCAQAAASQPSAMTPGHAGINLLTLACDDVDAVEARLRELDSEIVTRPAHVALGSGAPTRILLARGPRHELLEFVERSE